LEEFKPTVRKSLGQAVNWQRLDFGCQFSVVSYGWMPFLKVPKFLQLNIQLQKRQPSC